MPRRRRKRKGSPHPPSGSDPKRRGSVSATHPQDRLLLEDLIKQYCAEQSDHPQETITQESLKAQRIRKRNQRSIHHYVREAVRHLDLDLFQSFKKCPDDVRTFSTQDAERLPLLHVIIKESSEQPLKNVVEFLNCISWLDEVSDKENAAGKKAGASYPQRAFDILCYACTSDKYLSVVSALIKADTDIEGRNEEDGMTALHCAAQHGSMQITEYMLQRNISVDVLNARRQSSFLIACQNKKWETATLLFTNGANPFCKDAANKSPLSVTRDEVGSELMTHMATNTDVLDHLKKTMLLAEACRYGLDLLRKCCHDTNNLNAEQLHEAITEACRYGQIDIIEDLAKRIDDKSLNRFIEQEYSLNHFASMNQLLECAKHRSDMPCPNISLADTCRTSALMELTRYVAKYQKELKAREEALRTAAVHDNLAGVKYLIKLGTCVDVDVAPGVSLLTRMCESGRLDEVELLLSHGANINRGTDTTPLITCCKTGNKAIVERLLRNYPSPDLNRKNKQNRTAFDIAIINGHSTIALDLARRSALVSYEHLSFNDFCKVGCFELMRKFLLQSLSSQTADNEAMDNILRTNATDVMDFVLQSDKVLISADVVAQALQSACIFGSLSMFKILLHNYKNIHNRSITTDGISYLHLAVKRHHLDIIVFLLEQGIDAASGLKALDEAVQSRDILPLLLKDEISESILKDALMAICRRAHRTAEYCARLVIDKTTDKVGLLNHQDSNGETPLLNATLSKSSTLVQLLLNEGADPNCCDKRNRTPLSEACEIDNYEIASKLIYALAAAHSTSVQTDSPLPPSQQPLWIASIYGYVDLVWLLLDMKVDPNLTDDSGCSLTKRAHEKGLYEVVRLLLENGADPNQLTNVDLQQACNLGYAERALAIYPNTRDEQLRQCIAESYNSGFPETGLGIVIEIVPQSHLLNVLKENSANQPMSSMDTTTMPEAPSLWKCFECGDIDKMRQLLKDGEDPNVTDARGMPLLLNSLKLYRPAVFWLLMDSEATNIHVKDPIGRSALFYSLKFPRVPRHGEMICIFDHLIERGVKMEPDSFGRSLLHVWHPGYSVPIEKLTKHIPIDSTDDKGQTALHVAVMRNDYEAVKALLEAGNTHDPQLPDIPDINGLTPFQLAEDDKKMIDLQKHSQQQQTSQEESTQQEEHILEDKQCVFLGDRSEGQNIYSTLHEIFHRSKQLTSEGLYRKHYELTSLISREPEFETETNSFCTSVLDLMTDLGERVGRDNPLFAFKPVLSGSCSEGTKVNKLDEADVLCMLLHPDWKQLVVDNHEEGDFTFMKLESEELAKNHPKLFKKNLLSGHAIFTEFYSLIRKHLAPALRKHKHLYIVVSYHILHNDHGICSLELAWSGKLFKWQTFSLDVVPAFPTDNKKLKRQLNHHDLLHDLFLVPKWTAGLIEKPYTDTAFHLGFSYPEKTMFYAMPVALRQAYKLTKVLVHRCIVIDEVPASDFVSSFMMKCKAFECFSAMADFQERVSAYKKRDLITDEIQPPGEVLMWADRIFARLEDNMKQHRLESFFLPGSNLLGHARYREDCRGHLYVKLCRAMLHSPSDSSKAWTWLTQAVADQVIKLGKLPSTFEQDIKALLEMGLESTYRFSDSCSLMYYMVKHDSVEGVEMLLNKNGLVDNVDGRGKTALCLAAEKGKAEVLQFLQYNCAVHVVTRTDLTLDYEADWVVGIGGGENPRVVLQKRKKRNESQERHLVYAYALQGDGKFVQEWCKDLAHIITTDRCRIQVTATGEIMMQEARAGPRPTMLLERDAGRVIDTWRHEGELIDCLHPARPVYTQRRKGVRDLVVLDENHSVERTIKHAGKGWYLSVCEDKNGRMVVTSWADQTMSIYSPQGDVHIKLPYSPGLLNCVCCNSHCIMVGAGRWLPAAEVMIHSWKGEFLQRLTHQQLGIQGDSIHGLHWCESDQSLLLVEGWGYTSRSLHCYKMKYQYAPKDMVDDRRWYEELCKRRGLLQNQASSS